MGLTDTELAAELASLMADPDVVGTEIDKLTFDAWRLEAGASPGAVPGPLGFRRILVAVDGSEGAARALAWAERLAPVFKADVLVAMVVPPATVMDHYASAFMPAAILPGGAPLLQQEEERAAREVESAAHRLERAGAHAATTVLVGQPALELLKLAEREHADLIVVGSHGAGPLERAFLGSVADALKDHARASLLLARGMPPARRMLAPVDGSRASKRAAGIALRLSRAWREPASLLHVLAPVAAVPEDAMRDALARATGGLHLSWMQPRPSAAIEIGRPAERILAAARQEGAGLIVMGSRGLGGLRSLVAGSVSNRVAHQAKASMLLVKEANP